MQLHEHMPRGISAHGTLISLTGVRHQGVRTAAVSVGRAFMSGKASTKWVMYTCGSMARCLCTHHQHVSMHDF